MQLQGLILILFMIIIIPLSILFANDNVFFILLSILIIFTSVNGIYDKIFNFKTQSSNNKEEFSSDFKSELNIDIHKFGIGLSIAKNLIVILYLVYCTFFIELLFYKVLAALIISFRIFHVFKSISKQISSINPLWLDTIKNVYFVLIDIATILVIAVVSYNKYFNN